MATGTDAVESGRAESDRAVEAVLNAVVVHALRGARKLEELNAAIVSINSSFFLEKTPYELNELFALINLYIALEVRLRSGISMMDAVEQLLQSSEWSDATATMGLDGRCSVHVDRPKGA